MHSKKHKKQHMKYQKDSDNSRDFIQSYKNVR